MDLSGKSGASPRHTPHRTGHTIKAGINYRFGCGTPPRGTDSLLLFKTESPGIARGFFLCGVCDRLDSF
jgi:hypothetical protein